MPNHLSASALIDAYARADAADHVVAVCPHLHLGESPDDTAPVESEQDPALVLPDGVFGALCDANTRFGRLRFEAGLEPTPAAIRIWGAHGRAVFPVAVVSFPPDAAPDRIDQVAGRVRLARSLADRRPGLLIVVAVVILTALGVGWRSAVADVVSIVALAVAVASFAVPWALRRLTLRGTRIVDNREPARFDELWRLTSGDAAPIEIWSAAAERGEVAPGR